MDLQLFARVLWRFKFIVLLGLIVASVLALLSFMRVTVVDGRPHLSYRHAETWQSQEKLLVTQKGLTWGRTQLPFSFEGGTTIPTFADESRFSTLAVFYAQLAASDAVQQRLRQDTRNLIGEMAAAPLVAGSGSHANTLPILVITGSSTTPGGARRFATAGAEAFRTFLAKKQAVAGIAPSDRVLLPILSRASKAVLVEPRKKTLPIVVFSSVLLATLALVLILENLRPRIRVLETQDLPVQQSVSRSA